MNQSDSTSQSPSVPIETEEKPFSLNRGCEGCLAAFIALLALAFAVSLFFTQIFKLDRPLHLAIAFWVAWVLALVIGGYVAARRGKSTGWSNAWVVGVFAEFLIINQYIHEHGSFFRWKEAVAESVNAGPTLVAVVLTIPAAVLGGFVWSRRRR